MMRGQEPWHDALRAAVGQPTSPQPPPRPRGADHDREVLTASGFDHVGTFNFPHPHVWTLDSILGNLNSTSRLTRGVLGDEAERFDAYAWRRGAPAAEALPGRTAGTGPLGPPCYPLTASRRAFAALNDGTLDAAMATGCPVCGLRPPARRAATDDELPESGDGDGLVPREGVADGGEHGPDHALGGGPGRGRLGGDVGDEVVLVHLRFPLNCDRTARNGVSSG